MSSFGYSLGNHTGHGRWWCKCILCVPFFVQCSRKGSRYILFILSPVILSDVQWWINGFLDCYVLVWTRLWSLNLSGWESDLLCFRKRQITYSCRLYSSMKKKCIQSFFLTSESDVYHVDPEDDTHIIWSGLLSTSLKHALFLLLLVFESAVTTLPMWVRQ